MALDGDREQAVGRRVLSHRQEASGYVETPGERREPGEVMVRCAFCPDFAVGPVPLPESVKIARDHRTTHGIEGGARRQHRGDDKAALVARIKEMSGSGRSWASIAGEVGLSPSHVARLAKGTR